MPHNSDSPRPDIVHPHFHSVGDLPTGQGPGKIPTNDDLPSIAINNVMSVQGVGVIILDIPSGNTPLSFSVLQKLEILDAWLIKTDVDGVNTDAILLFRETPPGLPVALLGQIPVSFPVGSVVRPGDPTLSLDVAPGPNWLASRVFDVGDNLIVSRGLPLDTNNACTLHLLAVRRA